MLVKINRLRKKREFNYIYRKGNVFYSKFFVLYVAPTKKNFSKVGFSISNKIGNSVIRHKIKRRLSEVVRLNLETFPKNNYIFVAKQGCEKLSSDEIKQNIDFLLRKVKNEAQIKFL